MSTMMDDPYGALMGGGPMPPGPGMMPPEQGPADPASDMTAADHLRMAIEHAQAALVNEPDDADSQALSKVVAGLYQILASRQKDSDQTMGNPSLLRTLRRSGS